MYCTTDSYLRIGIIEYDPEECEHGVAEGVKVPRVRALRVGVTLAPRLVDHVENAMGYSHMTSQKLTNKEVQG